MTGTNLCKTIGSLVAQSEPINGQIDALNESQISDDSPELHSPEISALIERIRKSDTYYQSIRDQQLCNWSGFST